MNLTGAFLVAAGSAEAEIRVRGSRFIARAQPAADLAGAAEYRDSVRRRDHDATHHVYAARTHAGDHRFDDDGEPAGTGGRPVLAAIERAGVFDVVVVVTRYFGGTKLGTGGLSRAYGSAADRALEHLPGRRVVPGARVLLVYGYGDTGTVARVLEAAGAARIAERYGAGAELEVALPASRVCELEDAVKEATAGRVSVTALAGEMLLPVDT